MIERKEYLQTLSRLKDKRLIKVISGIRRCGKSTLLELFADKLRREGVLDECIISINLEDGDYFDIQTGRQLYDYIKERLQKDKQNYIFLDEVQRVEDFQKAVDGLYAKKNTDIYITGSNAHLLSGELATLLSGRYAEISMLPLSFREYVSARPNNTSVERLYRDYLLNSSFPYALNLNDRRDIIQYLESIYNTVVLKDIIARRRFPDLMMLESVIRFMLDNIGNISTSKKIADTMTSLGRKISVHTVESYLSALTDSFVLYRAGRYDLKGKQYLKTGEKYYAVDVGLRYCLLGAKEADAGHILENIVYLELLRRGCKVYVGKAGAAEIDFIAENNSGVSYYQIAYTVAGNDTLLKRELSPLLSVRNHNPKYLLTMDAVPETSYEGIKHINAPDWLLESI